MLCVCLKKNITKRKGESHQFAESYFILPEKITNTDEDKSEHYTMAPLLAACMKCLKIAYSEVH